MIPYGPELVRRLAREADLPGLRAGVRLDAGQADAAPGAGGDVDDPAVAALLHAGHDRARAEERARQVRVDDGLPVVVGDLLERPADLADDAARVVDEDVDPADPSRRSASTCAASRDVDRVAVAAVHGRAVRRERGGDPAADAVRRAGDERDAAV